MFEVIDVLDFAGGVGGKGESEIVGMDAAAVVTDADEFAAAVFDVDVDVGRTGIDGVFDDFFDHGGGAFNDFAGGDLVNEAVGQLLDAGHRFPHKWDCIWGTLSVILLPQHYCTVSFIFCAILNKLNSRYKNLLS